MANAGNAKFEILYAGALPPSIGLARDQAPTDALAALDTLGGNGGVLAEPRRSYHLDRQSALLRSL